jgi:hypothetical protein
VRISPSEPSKLLTSTINPAVLEVPVLFAAGERESPQNFDEVVNLPKKVFYRFRKEGALWAFALEADANHEAADTRQLAIPYFESVFNARLMANDTKLRPIDSAQGWLGNLTTHQIAPISQYVGNPLEAAWLPNEKTARIWQKYVTKPKFWNQVRYV